MQEQDIDIVELGDYVEIRPEEDIITEDHDKHHWVMQVLSMWKDRRVCSLLP